jgi:hypothetical protein
VTAGPRVLLRRLKKAGVPVVLIGGKAMMVHGSPRVSIECDFAARTTDIDRIIEVLYAAGYRVPRSAEPLRFSATAAAARAFAERGKVGALNFYLLDKGEIVDQVDFVFEIPVPFPRLRRRAKILESYEDLPVASLEDLETMKEKRLRAGGGGPADRADLRFIRSRKGRSRRGARPAR